MSEKTQLRIEQALTVIAFGALRLMIWLLWNL